MIILDATTKTLEVDLAGAISTSQLPITVNYVDVTTTTYTPGSSDTATNSTTAVTIVSAPAASTQRQVKLLTVYNADTASATVTIQLNNNATLRSLVVVVLAVGSTLIYTDGEGWRVLTSAGAIVTSTLSPMTSAQLAAIISDETGNGALVFGTSPTLTTPALGTPSALVGTNITGTAAGLTAGNVTTNANLTGPITSTGNATVVASQTGTGTTFVMNTSPTLVTPALGTPASGVLTNATGLPTAGLVDAAVTLAKMANLAQDQFIGRTTASTGVPETATITAAARTVLDDVTVGAMVDTLGGAAASGTGGLARLTSPTFATQISTPAIVAPAALTITPAAGSGVNIVLSTTGDFAVNTDNLYVDTSTGNIGIGMVLPGAQLQIKPTANWNIWSIGADASFSYIANNAQENGGTWSVIDGTYHGLQIETQVGTADTNTIFRFNFIDKTTGAKSNAITILKSGYMGILASSPTNLLSLGGNVARIFWMERNSVANTAGNTLTVQAGGATASATDKAGGDLILLPGASTGTGRANVRLRNYSRATASGTADNTAVDRLIVTGAVALTDAATSMFEVALTAGASAGGCIIWTIRASDGTDHQAFSGVTTFSAVNKAGIYTTTVTTNANNDAKAVSAGTLTVTFSLLNGADKVTVQVTPAGSLTESSYYQMSYTLFNNSPQSITVL